MRWKVLVGCLLAVAMSLTLSPIASGHGGHNGGNHGNQVNSEAFQRELAALREATARFHRVEEAIAEGYAPFGDCFIDPAGGMGFHYSNAELIEDPNVEPLHPELLLYERQADGSLRLIGVEYLTFQAAWRESGHSKLPKLFGEPFHLDTELLSEPFYLLHVWAWKHNPSGILNDWNPRVSCP